MCRVRISEIDDTAADESAPRPRFGWVAIAGVVILVILFGWLARDPSNESETLSDATVPVVFDQWLSARTRGDHARLVELTHSAFLTEDGGQHSEAKVRYEAALGMAISVHDCIQNPISGTAVHECRYERSNPIYEALGMSSEVGSVAIEVVDGRIAGFVLMFDIRSDSSDAFDLFPVWLSGTHPGLMNLLFGDEAWVTSTTDDDLQRDAGQLLALAEAFSPSNLAEVEALFSHPAIVASQTWRNAHGLFRFDAELWQRRLDESCGVEGGLGVWDHSVARLLASRYVEEDQAALESHRVADHDQAAQALWLMARNFCPDQFPDGTIEAGPPVP